MEQIEHLKDPAALKELVRVYAAENARLHRRLQELVTENAALKGKGAQEQLEWELARIQEQMSVLQKRLFGESSERGRKDGEEGEEGKKPKKKPEGHGPRPQKALRRQQLHLEIPADECVCPECEAPLQAMAGVTEDSEQITVIRREFVVQEVKRQKYRCRCGFGLHTAPPPIKHIPGGRYSLDFATEVAVAKYIDHQPLERQRKKMAREQLFVETQTLWDQLNALGRVLEPTYEALRQYIIGSDVIGVDETWWRLMQKKASKKWWAWGLTTHDACWFGIAGSRSAKAAAEYLGDFEGIVVCDAYRAYETLAKANSNVRLANCWAHVRRKFVEAEAHYPQCKEALEMIGELFKLERYTLDPSMLDGEFKDEMVAARHQLRNEAAVPILDKLRDWAFEQRGLPKSLLRKAVDYMLGHWKALTRFLENPFVPLHNNRTERALRGLVLGRKNHYGSRSKRGTKVAAIFYSLLDTAKLNGVEPAEYLVRAVTAAIDGRPPVLPLPTMA